MKQAKKISDPLSLHVNTKSNMIIEVKFMILISKNLNPLSKIGHLFPI